MVSLFLILGCNLSYIVDLFAALHELASASARTLLKLASSVRTLKPYGDTLRYACLVLVLFFFLAVAHQLILTTYFIQSEDPVAYKLASEFIKRTSSSLEPYLQMVRCTLF